MITQSTNLNLIPGQVLPHINVSQYDYGSRTLEFKLFNGNQSFALTSSMTARISGTKADMHGFEYDATVDTTNQKIVADLTQQMTAAAGDVTCELIIKKSGERLGTCNFVIAVEKAALGDDTIISDTELPVIIAEATAQMEAAAQSAEDAEAWADGTRDGEEVSSDDETYHNNSKYYSEQAGEYATDAGESAENASAYAGNALSSANAAAGSETAAARSAKAAEDSAEVAAAWSSNPPYIGANGNWWVFNTTTGTFVDSGIDASITVAIADVTMLAYNEAPYVTNTGTNTDCIFHLFIPRGANVSGCTKTGTSGLVDTYTMTFTDGTTCTFTVTNAKSITSVGKTSTSGLVDTYTITYNDGTTESFTVTNGEKGDKGDTGNGIASITKTGTAGLVDTYTITYTDGTTDTLTVTNGEKGDKGDTGNGISSVDKTSTAGLVDTYTITFTDGTTTTFTVVNGKGISTIAKTSTSGLVDTYTITYNDGTTESFTVTNGEKGDKGDTGNGIASIAKTSTSDLVDTYTITFTDGTTTTFTVTNGRDGTGSGDMSKADYDSNSDVLNAGGIAAYVTDQIETLDVSDSAVSGSYVTAVSETDGIISVTRETADATPTDSSTKMVTSGGVYDSEKEIYKTMGELGSKNLLPFNVADIKANNTDGTWVGNVYTNNDVHFTVNDDGTIDVTTEVTGASANARFIYPTIHLGTGKEFILSGCPANGGNGEYALRITVAGSSTAVVSDYGDGATLSTNTDDYGARIVVWSGKIISSSIKFKPMIRLASITDDTYQPYAKTNQELTAENEALTNEVTDMNNVYGSKNLYTLTMKHLMEDNTGGTWNENTYTLRGISYTCNFNDAGLLESVTINGTADADNAASLAVRSYGWINDMIGQSIIGVMETEDGSVGRARWNIGIRDKDEQTLLTSDYLYSDNAQRQATNVIVVPPNSHYVRSQIYVAKGTTLSNVTVKLMICLKSSYDLDPSWQPSSKTNRELTEDTTALFDNLEVNGAVNMLPNDAITQTINGLTFTVNDDKTVTANGTATADTAFILADSFHIGSGKTVKISGSPDGSNINNYFMRLTQANSSSGIINIPTGETIYTTTTDNYGFRIIIKNGQTASNLTFKPMITVASYNGDYVPYAKSNRELTEDVESIEAEMVKGGGYVYPLHSCLHMTITASLNSGQYIQLITSRGNVALKTSNSSIDTAINHQKVIKTIDNDNSSWTYSYSGMTANLNVTEQARGVIISNAPLTLTTSTTSTPEANTLDTLNLALLSNS